MTLPYRLASRLFHVLPLPPGKLAKSRAGRLAATARWLQWAHVSRTDGPLVWFHAASVGETQVISPLVTRFRARFPSCQTILTYSSPSMVAWPHDVGVDKRDFVPAELVKAMAGVFDTLRPSLIVVSRSDLWPEMVRAAGTRKVPVAIVGGAIHTTGRRLSRPARAVTKGLYRHLGFVGAVSDEDAASWVRLGAPRHAVRVTGDPRNDYVLERTPRESTLQPFTTWASGGPVMVAGSTHRRDEDVLVDAFASVCSRMHSIRLMIVPHEPDPECGDRVRRRARSHGLRAARWSGSCEDPTAPIVVVGEVGILADLYGLGTLAYVGGGFGPSGVHSLLEPAAFGIPVLTGSGTARDATTRAFVQSGGVLAVGDPAPAESLAALWTDLLADSNRRTETGRAAREQITPGAAAASMKALEMLLADVAPPEERSMG